MVDSVSDSLRPVKRGLCDCGYFFLFFLCVGVLLKITPHLHHPSPPMPHAVRPHAVRPHAARRTPHAARCQAARCQATVVGLRAGGLARWWACALPGYRGGLARCHVVM